MLTAGPTAILSPRPAARGAPTSRRRSYDAGMRSFAPHPFAMRWLDGLFLHWSVDPERLRPHVPDALELDVRDGRAWVSVLPFVLAEVRPRGVPRALGLSFPELNLRTYVRYDGWPGLYFFSIDVGHPLGAVLRRTTRLPCFRASTEVDSADGEVRFRSVRRSDDDPPALFAATYRPEGEPFGAEPGSLDRWLVERRHFFAPEGRRTLAGAIAHDPWPLCEASVEIEENGLFEAAGLPVPEGDPVARYCGDLSITGSLPRWLTSRRERRER